MDTLLDEFKLFYSSSCFPKSPIYYLLNKSTKLKSFAST